MSVWESALSRRATHLLERNERGERVKRFLEHVFDVFEKEADRIFMVDGDESITYAGVKEESGKIYHYLKDKGIGKEDFIQIIVKKDIHFVSCMLGVWRAGAAFVINDVNYPKDRLEYIGRDVDAKLILDAELFSSIMEEYEPLEGYEETGLHDACYAVYTSGSTGNPKGVLHEYGNLDQCLESYLPEAGIYYHYRGGYVAPLNFVVSIMITVRMISCAMTNFLVSDELLRDYLALTQFIEKNALDSIYLPPSYIRLYRSPAKCLKRIETGSEPANRLYYEGGVPEIVNSYGTSEAGFRVLSNILDRAYDVAPVGRPCLDIEFRLVDDEGEIVEGKGQGELCFKDEYVRGYIGLPEKTREAFVDGFYHTGDICRRDENGVYYICGRKDDMFKINGNRIEPAEIERWVKEITKLERVHAQGFQEEHRAFIVLYYIIDEAKKLGIYADGRLTCDMTMMGKYLPSYMIPAYYVGMEKFPLNINGKLDRRGFIPPKADEFQGEYTEPANELEKFFCDCMREVLGINRVGAGDDFYAIGGDSIGAMKLIAKCSQGGHEISISTLYECRTPGKLAEYVENESGRDIEQTDSKYKKEGVPLLPGQILHLIMKEEKHDSTTYNLPELYRLNDDIDTARLKAAIDTVTAAHPIYRTKLVKEEDTVRQVYDESIFSPVVVKEMTDLEFEACSKELLRAFDTYNCALYRFEIIKTPSAAYLFMDHHHLIIDGIGLKLLKSQIYDCYMDEGAIIPRDFYYAIAGMAGEEDSYIPRLKCSPALKSDMEGPDIGNAVLTGRGSSSGKKPGSLDYVLASAKALAEYNEADEATVFYTYNGRGSSIKNTSIGMYAVILPVYIDLSDNISAEKLKADIKQQMDHESAHLKMDWVAAALEAAALPCIALFNYQKDTVDEGSFVNIFSEKIRLISDEGQSAGIFTFGVIDNEGDADTTWYCRYSKGYYREESVKRFMKMFEDEVHNA